MFQAREVIDAILDAQVGRLLIGVLLMTVAIADVATILPGLRLYRALNDPHYPKATRPDAFVVP